MMFMLPNKNVNPCTNANASLGIDQACLSILNLYTYNVTFYSIIWNAYWGTGIPQAVLPPHSNTSLVVTTKYPLHIFYHADHEYCHTTYTFKEHGSYGWNISGSYKCSDIYKLQEPTNSYLPILGAFMILTLIATIWTMSKVFIKLIKGKLTPNNMQDDLDRLDEVESTTQPPIRITKSSTRIKSVDTFRGITILLMIFVDSGGGKYVFFNHAAWFGLTVADLVLPWFAWIMGLTITISKRAELRVTASRVKLILRCLRRSAILILFGLIYNSMNSKSLSDLRFPGVLQLLAVSYFVCATLETIFMKAHSQDTLLQFGRFAMFRDILDSWPQWLIMACIVTTHTLITFLFPVPNCPNGYFGPGGKYDHRGEYENCTAGAAGYIDRQVFGDHTYNKTNNFLYGSILRYDPEGIMNTISAIFIVFLGVHAGKILLLYYQCNSRFFRWAVWSFILLIIGGVLSNFGQQDGVLPISKNMMTLSFVLISSSFAFLLFAILYILVDYYQVWTGAPFIYAGTNPILLYLGHGLTNHLFPWAWNISNPTHASMLAMNMWTTTLWGIIAYCLYLKDIIITV